MKKYILILLLSTSSCFGGVDVCFTPGQDCTQSIINEIGRAKKQILVQAYSFSSKPIAMALVSDKNRGIDVKIILDKSQVKARYSLIPYLLKNHIPVFIDYRPAIAHNKIIIIDSIEVITGSFNFTEAAQHKNAENVLILTNGFKDVYSYGYLMEKYITNWKYRASESIGYVEYKKSKEGE